MSKKLAAKASLIQLPPVSAPGPAPGPAAGQRSEGEVRTKTAPGSMAHFMATQSSAVKEAEELRERVRAFDGAKPVRALDPTQVRPSRWANRHADSFNDQAFAELKADIAAAGTNVQPVAVRPIAAGSGGPSVGSAAGLLNGSTAPASPAFELVFGHRRHRACLELGLPVQAMVVELSDQALFEAMERENRARKNLSAWEQGTMYRRALDEGLYPSQRRLADALGVDVALVSKSLTLARLPDAVVQAFPSPLDIQFRWAQPLGEALQKDPDGLLARAAQIRQAPAPRTAAQVLAWLVGGAGEGGAPAVAVDRVLNGSTLAPQRIRSADGRQALVRRDARGRVLVQFDAGALSAAAEADLVALVEQLLARP